MKKTSNKKRIRLKGILIIIFLIYAAYTLVNQQITISKLTQAKLQKEQEIKKVQEMNEKLRQMVKTSNSDEYIEKMAREQLGLVKAGERVYIDNNLKEDKVKP